jgi:hypothetical protein
MAWLSFKSVGLYTCVVITASFYDWDFLERSWNLVAAVGWMTSFDPPFHSVKNLRHLALLGAAV